MIWAAKDVEQNKWQMLKVQHVQHDNQTKMNSDKNINI